MSNRGQGAFEYILLLAGILLIVILAIVILRGGVLSAANNQISGSLNTYLPLTSGCKAISALVIHPDGTNATVTLCQGVSPNDTVVYLYSTPITFNGASDYPANMDFYTNDLGNTVIFLDILGKNGSALDMGQAHTASVFVNGAPLVENLGGTEGDTTPPGPTPVPTPTPIPDPCEVNITEMGQTYSTPAYYCLNASLSGDGVEGVIFSNDADNGTLDCRGYSLTGNQTVGPGGVALTGAVNFTVKNCVLRDFYVGVYGEVNATIYNNTILNFSNGVSLVHAQGSNVTRNNITSSVSAHGIYAMNSEFLVISDNDISSYTRSLHLEQSPNASILNNRMATEWDVAIYLASEEDNFSNNVIDGPSGGPGVAFDIGANRCVFFNNTISNVDTGFDAVAPIGHGDHLLLNNTICEGIGTSALNIYTAQNASSAGNRCDADMCSQGGAYHVCVPDTDVGTDCPLACP